MKADGNNVVTHPVGSIQKKDKILDTSVWKATTYYSSPFCVPNPHPRALFRVFWFVGSFSPAWPLCVYSRWCGVEVIFPTSSV